MFGRWIGENCCCMQARNQIVSINIMTCVTFIQSQALLASVKQSSVEITATTPCAWGWGKRHLLLMCFAYTIATLHSGSNPLYVHTYSSVDSPDPMYIHITASMSHNSPEFVTGTARTCIVNGNLQSTHDISTGNSKYYRRSLVTRVCSYRWTETNGPENPDRCGVFKGMARIDDSWERWQGAGNTKHREQEGIASIVECEEELTWVTSKIRKLFRELKDISFGSAVVNEREYKFYPSWLL